MEYHDLRTGKKVKIESDESTENLVIKNSSPSVAKPKRKHYKKIFTGVFFILVALASFYIYKIVHAVSRITSENPQSKVSFFQLPKITNNQLEGEADDQINMLIIGIGGKTHIAGSLADTIMLASISPKSSKIHLVSIPRDMLVPIPNVKGTYDKINAIHSLGDNDARFKAVGGPKLLIQTLEPILGVKIPYYFRADFSGFEKLVDSVGGITVNVEKNIDDLSYPAPNMKDYEPFHIKAGSQKINGKTALKYARSRHSTSDFDRARRQQQVLQALKDKALSVGVLSNPTKIVEFIDIAGEHLKTNLQITQISHLISLIKNIDADHVSNLVLDSSESSPLTPGGCNGYCLMPKAGMGNYKKVSEVVAIELDNSKTSDIKNKITN